MVLLGLTLGMIRHGMKPKGWGSSLVQVSKAGKIGKMSLKGTLSVLSMAGAMPPFSSIESALVPDNLLGCQWLAAEKAKYLSEMASKELGWFQKPWSISGSIICMVILCSGGGLGICKCRKMRSGGQDRRCGGQDRREGGNIERNGGTSADGTLAWPVRKETVPAEPQPLRFGDIRMEKLVASDV